MKPPRSPGPGRTLRRHTVTSNRPAGALSSEVRTLRAVVAALSDQVAHLSRAAAPEAGRAPSAPAPVDLVERRAAAYARVRERLLSAVARVVPAGETVLVISRGDDELLDLAGHSGWHFPRTADGTWAGHHPADSAAAIAHLEQQRSAGAHYLVIPAPSSWWLSHYAGFRAHLERTGRLLLRDDTGVVIAIEPSGAAHVQDPQSHQSHESRNTP
jgi:hypothetical protein